MAVAIALVLIVWPKPSQTEEERLAAAAAVPSSVQTTTSPPTVAGPVTSEPSTPATPPPNPLPPAEAPPTVAANQPIVPASPSPPATPPPATPPPNPLPPAEAPPAVAATQPIVPAYLVVPSLELKTTVAPKPTEMLPDKFLGGQLVSSFGVPPDSDMVTTTWWSSGPNPGDPGMAIVLGHTQIGAYGVFNDLGKLKPGSDAFVSDGQATLHFRVIRVQERISKKDPTALQAALTNQPTDARLAFVTCSGYFDGTESEDNTIAFLSLIQPGSVKGY